MKRALNQMTVRHLDYATFLDVARDTGCMGVEVRNDLGRPVFDGIDPAKAGEMARARGLRLLGMSEVYAFNSWSQDIMRKVEQILADAKASGAETISLIPRNDGTGTSDGARQANLRVALEEIKPMLEDADMVALVEPLGFERSSLRSKVELVEIIEALNATDRYKLVHDTFHHTLAHGGPFFAEHTGIVHISGVVDPGLSVGQMEDEHRILVDERDRLENLEQIEILLKRGYDGAISYECFAPEVQALSADEARVQIAQSFDFIETRLAAVAA